MKPPRFITGEFFLRGPIPLTWLNAAGCLGGKALNVGVNVWHLAGLHDSMSVKLSTRKLQAIGVARKAGYQALGAMECAGLIQVERRRGRCPVVTIISRSREASITATAMDLS